jgi:hypothetical protein
VTLPHLDKSDTNTRPAKASSIAPGRSDIKVSDTNPEAGVPGRDALLLQYHLAWAGKCPTITLGFIASKATMADFPSGAAECIPA